MSVGICGLCVCVFERLSVRVYVRSHFDHMHLFGGQDMFLKTQGLLCRVNYDAEKMVCRKSRENRGPPVTPIVGRTSEMLIICFHVCAYAHSDALCANFELCAEGTTCINCRHARPRATLRGRRMIVGQERQPFHVS